MFFALHVRFHVLCIWPVSEGRREFGELMEGKKSLVLCVCETNTQLLLCGLNSGPNKDVSLMKAVVAAENTEHTAGFSPHSLLHAMNTLHGIRIPILNTRQSPITGIVLQYTCSECGILECLDLRASNLCAMIQVTATAKRAAIWAWYDALGDIVVMDAGMLPKEGGQWCRLHIFDLAWCILLPRFTRCGLCG